MNESGVVIAAALTGNYCAEHQFALKQNFDAYQFLLKQIAECDAVIEALLTTLAAKQPQPQAALPAARQPKNHAPCFELRSPLHRLTGGTDLSRWQTEQHFTSWLALAPHNKISGGRLLSSKTTPSANRAAVVLRRCAMSLSRTSTALGAFYRRLAARKLAVLVYRALCGRLVYQDLGAVRYQLSIGPARLSPCANAPHSSASNSSTPLPAKC